MLRRKSHRATGGRKKIIEREEGAITKRRERISPNVKKIKRETTSLKGRIIFT